MQENEENGSMPILRRGHVVYNIAADHCVDQYTVLNFLGKGGFGECFSAESFLLKDYVAIKVVSKAKLKESQYQKIYREVELHRRAHHGNIVRMYDAFHDKNNFYMILELCKAQSLLNIINETHRTKGYFDEYLGSRYVNQLCEAVLYLSQQHVLHRDIKPGNVFISRRGEVKLGDFGLAAEMRHLNRGSISGTPNYLAPEVIGKEGHSLASEIWSIGCLIYCLLVGKPPFEADSVTATYDRITSGMYSYPRIPEVSPSAKDLIHDCLELDPDSRLPIYFIQEKPWLANTKSNAGYPLMRAKSAGNMIIPRDINGNQLVQMPGRYLRPKSATMIANASLSDKSRRKSITASHDSGFGSETDMFRTQNLAVHNLIEKINNYIGDMKSVRNGSFVLRPATMPPLAISKWVDYTNRRGFACKLTDGSLSVKFNDGTCLSWPNDSDILLYANHPFAPPKLLDMKSENISDIEMDHIAIASEYNDYMEKELQGLDGRVQLEHSPRPIDESVYIVFQRYDQKHLFVVFNNGLVQICILPSKAKLLFWKEDDRHYTGFALITKDMPPCSFRIVPQSKSKEIFCPDDSMVPIAIPMRVYEFLHEGCVLLEDEKPRIVSIRGNQSTPC